jgi:hypothetical protein
LRPFACFASAKSSSLYEQSTLSRQDRLRCAYTPAFEKETTMVTGRKRKLYLFVDRSSGRWIVQDQDGVFWIIPVLEEAWEHRKLFTATDVLELEPVPEHYKYVLGLPP